MAYPMVSICRKSDEYSARYDQKGVAAGMLSSHHCGAADVFQLQMGFFTNSPLGTFYCSDLRKISKKHLTNAGKKRFVGLNLETT